MLTYTEDEPIDWFFPYYVPGFVQRHDEELKNKHVTNTEKLHKMSYKLQQGHSPSCSFGTLKETQR